MPHGFHFLVEDAHDQDAALLFAVEDGMATALDPKIPLTLAHRPSGLGVHRQVLKGEMEGADIALRLLGAPLLDGVTGNLPKVGGRCDGKRVAIHPHLVLRPRLPPGCRGG